jgi:predicted Rossmann fold flavoprotein
LSKQLIVIGGGAAGFFCAVNAARINPSLKVTIVEKTNKLLSKVKVSGGGRCNVTHSCFDISEMSKRYPRGANFVKKTFHQFFTSDTIKWFDERGVLIKAEADGRMFPVTNSSQTIIDCLIKETNQYRVEILLNAEVQKVIKKEERFELSLADARILTADYLCIASGGYPKSSMFDWLSALDHTIEEPVPSLFTFNMPGNPIVKLMGVSVSEARIKITSSKLEETGPVLITHWGLSGPAILRLSAWGAKELALKKYNFNISINWLPSFNEQTLRDQFQQMRFQLASQKVVHKNPFGLPNRLWFFLTEQCGIQDTILWADLPSAIQNKLIKNLCTYECEVKGKTTFKEEFVTAGGIRLSEVDANTMMSKKMANLYFAGEVLDIDGITGGFNFQNAWTTGFIAAKNIAAIAS